MPVQLVCPGCSHRKTAPDLVAGMAVRCPKCHTKFIAPQAEKDDQRAAPKWPEKDDHKSSPICEQGQGPPPLSIPIVCPNCTASAHAPDEAAGRKVKCRKCGKRFIVPTT